MNKGFKRILAAFLVLCMIPAAVITAFAHGPGVAGNSTPNQSYDNAKGQFIPETIVVDGKFDDTGWPIEGWNYVTSTTGNWDVETPESKSQQLMYQYQLRADGKYFYVGAVVVLPDGVDSGAFTVYLSDAKSGNYEVTTAAFEFVLGGETVTVNAIDCRSDDGIDVGISANHQLDGKLVDTNKYYIEFRNNIADTYNAANEIRYFVSASVSVNGKENELFHPIYYTVDGVHSVPTLEFWPGGGKTLSMMGEGDDTYVGAVTIDGNFDEAIWSDSNNATGFTASNFVEDGGWTVVAPYVNNSRWQNTSAIIDGFSYKYKIASDGTKLYVAVVMNSPFHTGAVNYGSNVRFWIKTNSSYKCFTHFYDVNDQGGQARYNKSDKKNDHDNISNTSFVQSIKAVGNTTHFEFSVNLSEFNGTNGFQYYIAAYNMVNGVYGCLYNGAYSTTPWEDWDENNDTEISSINSIKTTGTFSADGDFSDTIWNYTSCDVFDSVVTDMKADDNYIYGKATVQFKSGKSMSDVDKIRLWVAGDKPYAVDLKSANCEIIAIKDSITAEEVSVGNGESAYTTSGNTTTFEFKVPLGTVGCKSASDVVYYVSAEKGESRTLYSNKISGASYVNINSAEFKTRATIGVKAVEAAIKIDGNLEEEAWGTDFYNATFGNSVVMQQPKWGGSYGYSYKIYGGSGYIYGAVELDGVANDKTVFTLWLDNATDEYAWIGDNDSNTPHIPYEAYLADPLTVNTYTGDVTLNSNGSYSGVVSGETNISVNRLKYFTNFKYEFKLGSGTAVATPDFYFPTDSNLEKDKVKITKGENYDYAVQTINGKTYLEFKIDVKNFLWNVEKPEEIEYITSMTHEVNENKAETITVYNPAINDRSNFWVTNINQQNGACHDAVGYLYNSVADFKESPTRYWYAVKFKPVAGSSSQYEIIEMINGGENKYADKKPEEIFTYTKAEQDAGILCYFTYTGTMYNNYGKTYTADEINYPSNRYIDVISVKKNGKLYYLNRNLYDGRNVRAYDSRVMLFSWNVGDIVEFGYNDGTSATTSVLTGSQLASHEDLTTKEDIDNMPGWIHYNSHKDLPVLDADKVAILSYEYEDIVEVGGNKNNTGYGNDSNLSELNDGAKNTMSIEKSVVLYMHQGTKDAKDATSIIADLGSAKTTNAYTAYLTGGQAGLNSLNTSLEIYGSNDKSNWERITGASYRQILLQKGDGLTIHDDDKENANVPTITFASSNGAELKPSRPSINVLSDGEWAKDYDGNYDAGNGSNWWDQASSKAFLIKNTKYETNNDTSFDIIFEYPIERSINQIDITYFTLINRIIGVPEANVKIWTSSDGVEWKHAKTVTQTGLPVFDEKSDIYNSNNAVLSQHKNVKLYNAKGNLGDTYTSKFFKLTFTFPDYPGGVYYYNDKETNALKSSKMLEWDHIGFTEIDLTHTLDTNVQGKRVPYDVDSYSLTAVAEEPVNYRYLKYTLIETSMEMMNCVALDEIEAHYSTALDALPKQTILHLNTEQRKNVVSLDPTKDIYLGRHNTVGAITTNNGSSMTQPNTNANYSNQVFAETVLVPGFNYNANSDVGFYTNFYIERVSTSPISQPDKPVDTPDTELNWDNRNANVLKKLEHIAPDRVVIDGNLNDTGWDGVWTDADGLKNATNLDGTGTTFKYQLRTDGEYLYAAAIIDSAYDATNAPKFGIWLKGNDGIAYYSVGYGETVVDFTKPQSTAEYGAIETLSIATKNGATYDEANEKLTFAYDLVAKKNGENIANSYLFGYTDEIMESTSDGIWVWEGRPQTQSFTIANDSAMMSASGSTLVTGLNNVGEGKTLVEFKVKLDEFGGKDGFEYFVEATSSSGTTIYPYVRAENGHKDANYPENNWDSNEAIKVTAEDMTGWGDYRMVEDFAPVTSLGAKVNPSYKDRKTIRFGARYTEEFIRRQNVVDGTDYWMVADVGIIILPTQLLGDEELTLDTSNTAGASAQDIVNWQNVTDEGTNFADYESFVFYVNLVGVEGIESVPLTFRSYVDYYNAENGSDTYYSIPLERSYDGVYNTANENEEGILPN